MGQTPIPLHRAGPIPSDKPASPTSLADAAFGDTVPGPERASTRAVRSPITAFASLDPTAPPSSHTLRTSTDPGALEAPLPPRTLRASAGGAAFRMAGFGAVLLAAGTGVGVQRARRSWPFTVPPTVASAPASASAAPTGPIRLRDLPVSEIDRRIRTAGLGSCTVRDDVYDSHVVACERSNLLWKREGEWLPSDMVQRSADYNLYSAWKGYGRGELAVDDHVCLVLGAPAAVAKAAFDVLLEGVVVERRQEWTETETPVAPPEGKAGALAKWGGDDLVDHVFVLGGNLQSAGATSASVYRLVIDRGRARVTFTLSSGRPAETLEEYKKSRALGRFAYAIDGDKLLVMTGADSQEPLEYLKKILDGTHTSEVGVEPPPAKTKATPKP